MKQRRIQDIAKFIKIQKNKMKSPLKQKGMRPHRQNGH